MRESVKAAIEQTQAISGARSDIQIRWSIRRDLTHILDIHADRFGELAWSEEDYLCCLRRSNCITMVAERHEEILGFMVYELFPGRMVLRRIAVRWTREGVGSVLLRRLQEKCRGQRRREIIADAPAERLAAHLFLRAHGFRATEVLRESDAYRFRWRVQSQ